MRCFGGMRQMRSARCNRGNAMRRPQVGRQKGVDFAWNPAGTRRGARSMGCPAKATARRGSRKVRELCLSDELSVRAILNMRRASRALAFPTRICRAGGGPARAEAELRGMGVRLLFEVFARSKRGYDVGRDKVCDAVYLEVGHLLYDCRACEKILARGHH